MSLLTTLLDPTSVIRAECANLVPGDRNLAIAKAASLDIFTVKNGLELLYTLPIRGKIASLTAVPTKSSSQDWLLLSTDRGEIFVVWYSNENKFESMKQGELLTGEHKPNNYNNNNNFDGHIVAVNSKYIAMVLAQGYIHVFTIPKSKRSKGQNLFSQAATANLEFVRPLKIEFVNENTLAILHNDPTTQQTHIAYMALSSTKSPFTITRLGVAKSVIDSNTIMSLPPESPVPGVLALGTHIFHVSPPDPENRNKPIRVRKLKNFSEDGSITTWAAIDNGRYVVGTENGQLYLLLLKARSGDETIIPELHPIGNIPPPSSLLHLSSKYFFASSYLGNSVLFSINRSPLQAEVIQEIENTGPITDVLYVKEFGVEKFVIGSGGFDCGGLSQVQRGVRFEEDLQLDLGRQEDIHNLWTFGNNILVATGTGFTSVYFIDQAKGSVAVVSGSGIDSTCETLAIDCESKDGQDDIYIQVTRHGVVTTQNTWNPINNGGEISVATFWKDYIVCCSDRNVSLLHRKDSNSMCAVAEFGSDIAVVEPVGDYLVLALWGRKSLKFMQLLQESDGTNILKCRFEIELGSEGVIRSIVALNGNITVGHSNGEISVIPLELKEVSMQTDEGNPSPGPIETFVTGQGPVSLIDYNGRVLAWSDCCFFPTYRPGFKYCPTVVDLQVPRCATVDSNGQLILANGSTVTFGTMGTPGVLMTNKLQLGGAVQEMVRFKDHYVVCIMTKDAGKIALVNQKFEVTDSIELENETPTCVQVVFNGDNDDFNNEFEGIVIGTASETDNKAQNSGRLLLLTVDDQQKLSQLHSLETAAEVLALTFDSPEFTVPSLQILASIGKQVRVINILRPDIQQNYQLSMLELSSEYNSLSFTRRLAASGYYVLTGDLLHGVSIAHFKPSESLRRLNTIPRESCTVLCCDINGNSICYSDLDGVLTYKEFDDKDGIPFAEETRQERDNRLQEENEGDGNNEMASGEPHSRLIKANECRVYSDFTCIKAVPLDMIDNGQAVQKRHPGPRFLVGTSHGGLYLVSSLQLEIDEEYEELLSNSLRQTCSIVEDKVSVNLDGEYLPAMYRLNHGGEIADKALDHLRETDLLSTPSDLKWL